MNTQALNPTFKGSWQLLSAQSSKILLWFIAIHFLNFAIVMLNLRIPKVVDNAIWGQIFWCITLGAALGGMDLLRKRQEFVATLPISRSKAFLNRLLFGLLGVLVLTLLNYCLNSGLAEQEVYGEVWMEVKSIHFTLLNTSILLSTFLCSFAMAAVARTFTGIVLSFIGVYSFFSPVFLSDLVLESPMFRLLFYGAALILISFSFYSFQKVDRLRQGVSGVTNLGVVSLVYWLLLVGFGILTMSNL
jgi:hypothetical protein